MLGIRLGIAPKKHRCGRGGFKKGSVKLPVFAKQPLQLPSCKFRRETRSREWHRHCSPRLIVPTLRRWAVRLLVCVGAFNFGMFGMTGAVAAAAEDGHEKRPENGYWSEEPVRWFVSTKSDLGLPYLKPYVSAGYGIPHWIWTGVDLNAITTLEFTQIYAGVRASSPVLDFAFGFRDTWSFYKPLLPVQATYTRADVLEGPGASARYWAWEAEVVALVPLPHSALVADWIVVRTLDVPRSAALYEESYRAVVTDPLYMVLRVAPVLRLLNESALKVGVLGEYVFSTGRSEPVLRFGPVGALQLTDHLEAIAGVTFAVASPDRLGLALSSYGTACFRYRWATGERRPELPWRGELIP